MGYLVSIGENQGLAPLSYKCIGESELFRWSKGADKWVQVPEEAWAANWISFLTGLPKLEGKGVILVIEERLTKYCHLFALAHPYTKA